MKLNREALAHYLDSSFKMAPTTAVWEIIGDDIEEMSVELNPDISTVKNILGQTKTKDNGYEPNIDADPFYADPDKKIYPQIRDIAFNRIKGDKCRTLLLEVVVEDTSSDKHAAWVQEVIIKPQSYGGGTEGINIPFQISEDGKRTKGYVTSASLESGNPTFTEGEIPSSIAAKSSLPEKTSLT